MQLRYGALLDNYIPLSFLHYFLNHSSIIKLLCNGLTIHKYRVYG